MLNTFLKCLVKENSEQRRKRKNKLPDDPKIPPPGRRDCTSKRHMHPMLTAALFTTVKTWKQPKNPSDCPGGSEGRVQWRNRGFNPCTGKIPWRREWLPAPAFVPGESHGQRSLASYSSWGHKESDTTEWLPLSLLSSIHHHKNG